MRPLKKIRKAKPILAGKRAKLSRIGKVSRTGDGYPKGLISLIYWTKNDPKLQARFRENQKAVMKEFRLTPKQVKAVTAVFGADFKDILVDLDGIWLEIGKELLIPGASPAFW